MKLAKMKLDKIEKGMSGVKFAHIKLELNTTNEPEKYKYNKYWDIQCTGFGIVVKGDHNIDTFRWFLNKVEELNLETEIRKFAIEVFKANEIINQTKKVA